MKKINLKLISIVLAIFSIALLSCDEEETAKENSFKYDGKTYKISKGLIENWGAPEIYKGAKSVYEVDLTFITKEFSLNETDGNISGTGSYIFLGFISSSDTQLPSGTYTFDDDDTGTPGTFYYGEVGINLIFFAEEGYKVIDNGIIKIELDGNKYEITIDCIDKDYKKLSGYYKGELVFIDQTLTKNLKARR